MPSSHKFFLNLTACIALSVLAAACSSADLGFGGVKEALVGKPVETSPNVPERPKLVMPPPNAPLPVPGQTAQTAAAWRPQTQQPQQTAVQEAKSDDSGSSWYSGIFGSSEDKKTQ